MNNVHTIVNGVTRKRMSFTRIAFFPGVAGPPGPARRMRENDMTVMTSWDLFDDLRNAQDELVRQSRMPGHWASGQFGQQPGADPAGQAWAPAVDITERKDAYLVTAELPGVGTEDVEITFQDGLLTIQGERHPAPRRGRREGPPGRAPLRRVPPVDHPAQPCPGGQDRGLRPGRRPADPSAQGRRKYTPSASRCAPARASPQ